MTSQEELVQLLDRYRSLGIIHGVEFLLAPDVASRFVDDLVCIGIVITGMDGWAYVDKSKGWIVQDLEVDFTVPDQILEGDNPAGESAAIVKRYIEDQVPKRIDFVSFSLNVPLDWSLVPSS